MTERNNPQTVKFNVGGKLFETARSLIDQHDGTMLARLVSDTWQEDPTKPVFIDRCSDMFTHVLNYLRYESIILPANLPKEMFLRDLDFYGIVPGEGSVKTNSEGWATQVKGRRTNISKLQSEAKELKLDNDIDFLANYCANCYVNGATDLRACQCTNETNSIKNQLWKAVSCCA